MAKMIWNIGDKTVFEAVVQGSNTDGFRAYCRRQ